MVKTRRRRKSLRAPSLTVKTVGAKRYHFARFPQPDGSPRQDVRYGNARDVRKAEAVEAFQRFLLKLRRENGAARLVPKTVNEYAREAAHVIRFGHRAGRIPAEAVVGLSDVPPVTAKARGTRSSTRRETVELESYRATLPHLTAPAGALIEVLYWTDARPSELYGLRPCDLARSERVWTFEPGEHATSGKGHRRLVFFGKNAQRVLEPLLDRTADAPLLDSWEGMTDRHRRAREARETPLCPSHARRQSGHREATGTTYGKDTLRRAVQRAVKAANLIDDVESWTPYQLRHTTATRFRAGVDRDRTVAVLLGHAPTTMSDRYGDPDWSAAADAAWSLC